MKKITLLLACFATTFLFAQDPIEVSISSTQGSLPTLQRDTDYDGNFHPEGFGIATTSVATDLIVTISKIDFQSGGSFTFFFPIRNGEAALGTNIGSGNCANIAETTVDESNSVLQGDGTYTFTMNIAPILLSDGTTITGTKLSAALNSFNVTGGTNNSYAGNNLSLGTFDVIVSSDDILLGVNDFSRENLSSIVKSANPVKNTIELKASGKYSIISIMGKTVLSGNFSNTINVEKLTTGLYILAIDGGDVRGTYKFVKK